MTKEEKSKPKPTKNKFLLGLENPVIPSKKTPQTIGGWVVGPREAALLANIPAEDRV